MIKRNEAAKRAGELGLEWDPEKYEAAKAQPQKYKISAVAISERILAVVHHWHVVVLDSLGGALVFAFFHKIILST